MNTNTTIRNRSGGVDIKPEKLYTQLEVDALLEKGEDSRYEASEIRKETRAADKLKRLNKRNVANLVKKSNRILLSISSHAIPFDIFPNVLNIEEKRITIIKRHILSSEVHSIDIKNISNILINNSIFFSELVIISKTYEENEIRMNNLRTKDAIFARRIIEGLRIFENENIDTYDYTTEKLISKLEELSKTNIVK
ncbi:MAG: hypothetical protein ACW963_09370 [Candidatus Sifarchaeia archaeon]